MTTGSSHLACSYLQCLDNRVESSGCRFIKLSAHVSSTVWTGVDPRAVSRRFAISCTEVGRGAALRSSRENIHWINDCSSVLVNLWLLARVSANVRPVRRRWSVVRGT